MGLKIKIMEIYFLLGNVICNTLLTSWSVISSNDSMILASLKSRSPAVMGGGVYLCGALISLPGKDDSGHRDKFKIIQVYY